MARARHTQPFTRCEEGLRDPREASVSPPAEASVDEGLRRRRPRVLFLRARPFVLRPPPAAGPLSLQLLLRDWQQFLGAEKRRDQSTVSREGNGKRKKAETALFSTPPPGGRPEQKARQAEGEKGKDTMKGGVVKRMVHDLQDGPCVSLPRRGCKASANDTLVARRAKPSRRWSSLAHHPLEPPPCSSMLGTQRSPLPSPPLEPPLPPPSHIELWGRPPLASPPHTLFCDISLLLLAAPPDIWDRLRFGFLGTCETDPSHVVARCDVDIRRCQRSRPTTRLRRARCGWRPGNRRQGECDGKSPLVSHHEEGSREGERRRHAQPRRAPPPGPN